jgi:hypothetical protein
MPATCFGTRTNENAYSVDENACLYALRMTGRKNAFVNKKI